MIASWLLTLLLLGRALRGWGAFLGLLLSLAAHGQPTKPKPAPFAFKNARTRSLTLPVEIQRNLLIISTYLNGQGPFNFLLDTGVGTSLLTDPTLRTKLGLRLGRRFRVAGAGQDQPLEAFQTDSVQMTLGDGKVVAPTLTFLILSSDVLNLSGYVGMPIHGILGYDIFHSFVVRIHPAESRIILFSPTTFRAPRGRRWTSMGIDLEGSKAYLRTQAVVHDSLTLPLKLVLDTGAGHALSLETTSDPRLTLPSRRVRSQLGRGLNGLINGYLGRVSSLQLGKYKIKSLVTSFPDAADVSQRAEVFRNGNVGLELLKRFDIIIDYTRNQLWLRPNSLYHDPFEHDMSGLDLLATGSDYRHYIILKVEEGSPADVAGLQPTDEILAINLLPVAGLSLTQISRILHSDDGRPLLLIVRRANGELITTTVRLKRQI
ncbi:PDZ/DHR/GLGF domain protein [Hymenobacter roseosalivarius DSM 11622]|uniref:PDZ/DHR/GLGF domain protein n=1 Tax=Hymenobacter roseosalivarius DSM 11622 TaxID=645990 RepID=A0A1W1VYE7_9BACT|nr:aspartyl protease family protein [Hymenobacter roseosalivarius]SMB98121.1 PDZ/DHR/GLGF domain protein [Hymenobacter roseosalivarius DSM 11622]